jgi:ribosome-associated protein
MNEQSFKMAQIAVNCLEDKKAASVKVIDISNISILGDYFIIAEGSNRNQIQAMADHVEENLGKAGFVPKNIEGYNNANWVLMDYRDIIIHIFDPDTRSYYDLERIWRDGVSVDVSEFRS